MTVAQNSYVQLGGGSGMLNPPNETLVPNGGFGIGVSLNSSAGRRRGTLTGAQGAKDFNTSSTNGTVRK